MKHTNTVDGARRIHSERGQSAQQRLPHVPSTCCYPIQVVTQKLRVLQGRSNRRSFCMSSMGDSATATQHTRLCGDGCSGSSTAPRTTTKRRVEPKSANAGVKSSTNAPLPPCPAQGNLPEQHCADDRHTGPKRHTCSSADASPALSTSVTARSGVTTSAVTDAARGRASAMNSSLHTLPSNGAAPRRSSTHVAQDIGQFEYCDPSLPYSHNPILTHYHMRRTVAVPSLAKKSDKERLDGGACDSPSVRMTVTADGDRWLQHYVPRVDPYRLEPFLGRFGYSDFRLTFDSVQAEPVSSLYIEPKRQFYTTNHVLMGTLNNS